MTTFWQSGKTVVTRLRVRCSGIDPISAQLRVASLFNAAHVHPVGLPPSAIICIRKLLDPQPGTLRLAQGSVRPPLAWEQAVAASLDQLVRRAARPARGAVSANVEAVLFRDQSELLACLASDWCDGIAITRWWWQSLLKGTDLAHTVRRAWLDAPEYTSAALQHMAESGQAVAFAQALSVHDARVLLKSMARSFALHELQSALDVVLDESRQALSSGVKALEPGGTAHQLDLSSSVFNTPQGVPWQRWVPESQDNGLRLEQQCFLGIGLMLQRAPTVVRTPSFARAVLQWHREEQLSDARDTFKAAVGQAIMDEPGLLPTKDSEDNVDANDSLMPSSTLNVENQVVSSEPPRANRIGPATPPAMAPQRTDDVTLPAPEQEYAHMAQHAPSCAPDMTTPSISQTPDTVPMTEAYITTALGGVFYLINLSLFLHVYGDFTTPAQPGIALPVWDFVALLGQQLVGEKMRADPVWSLLAGLAGRSGQEAPGNGFDPPHAWRLPEEWLEPFPEAGLWQWEAAHGRLWVQHPEQFWVLDVPGAAGSSLQHLQDELQAYRDTAAFELQPASLPGRMDGIAPLERWLGWLMPYVRSRLQRALGIADADELPRVLCEHQARVYVTATHLDIFLALEALPIAIRLAGLDRDPGWVPAAGRYIAFHFE